MLQRIYGTAFSSSEGAPKKPTSSMLEEAKKRDHRKLGKELDLFMFHRATRRPSPFFLPRGAGIYTAARQLHARPLRRATGYDEVLTPQVFDNEAVRDEPAISPNYAREHVHGHVTADIGGRGVQGAGRRAPADEAGCAEDLHEGVRYRREADELPQSHCLIYKHEVARSYRELPLAHRRLLPASPLRARAGWCTGSPGYARFAQDDAHIFCTPEQVQAEIADFLDLVHRVYEDFGFEDVRVVVATRPEKRLGNDEEWDLAEAALVQAVEAKGLPHEIAEGEGAFYGPKIEFHLKDALKRPWQLGTIQADFVLPRRFGLEYVGADNTTHRPVMLHRAILGSVERFFAVLVEHVGGRFPVWLAPEQATVLTVSQRFNDYGEQVVERLRAAGHRVTSNLSDEKLGAKIRSARLMRVPYLLVVGGDEAERGGVAVRSRDENRDLGFMPSKTSWRGSPTSTCLPRFDAHEAFRPSLATSLRDRGMDDEINCLLPPRRQSV